MGMTIDKAIEEVQQQKLDYQEFWEEYKNEHIEALDIAIDTMCKYQKIEKIVNNTFQNIAKEDERYAFEWLGDIKEVLEDATN